MELGKGVRQDPVKHEVNAIGKYIAQQREWNYGAPIKDDYFRRLSENQVPQMIKPNRLEKLAGSYSGLPRNDSTYSPNLAIPPVYSTTSLPGYAAGSASSKKYGCCYK